MLAIMKYQKNGFCVDENIKLVLAIMKNQKNGSNSPKIHPRAKLPITDPPKVWVSGFHSVDRNGKLVSAIMKNQKNGFCVDGNGKLVLAIMKNQKNGSNSPKMHPRAKLPITDPPLKFGSAVFPVLTEMENWC